MSRELARLCGRPLGEYVYEPQRFECMPSLFQARAGVLSQG